MADHQRRGGITSMRTRMGGWAAGVDFAAMVLSFVLLGWGADALFGTSPILLIVFAVVGLLAGFTAFLRTASRLNRERDR
ncbi:MAG: AtpZ/AtpI family protein [Planctomycetota bacterium]